ncbi:hypothetical protein TNCT_257501 [Trichonephila clavata]|uniref:Uncharacterized protein n=1 Tax=Trichonephila clavata TaxID=2740835 RepID=A0A8X6IIH8_TRICU|nr:hypothetical protein TNCT_257501 [Trichonephila clavata]
MKTEHDNLLPESERLSFAWNVTPSHWRDDKQNPFGHTVTAIAFEISPRNPDGNTSRRMSFKNGKKRDPVKYGPMKQLFFKFHQIRSLSLSPKRDARPSVSMHSKSIRLGEWNSLVYPLGRLL